ncbi:MAG: hypothetical protein J0H66_07590 [Solirubrobacterales bacterium]|mgnify:CR=1 FL=1|nr:hypothetical protein [Solirubrobacterales bacterium]OJU93238.1 MAG: hypothetical protein BGO23_11125 [Solirubrobacterales bacterium 67-14]
MFSSWLGKAVGVVASLGVAALVLTSLGGPALAGEPASPLDPHACVSDKRVAATAAAFTNALASPGVEDLGAFTSGEFLAFSTYAPIRLVPEIKRYDRADRRNGYFAAHTPASLLKFKRQVGVLPLRLGALAILHRGARSQNGRYADFGYTGRVRGRAPWRRKLQFQGKGAINCDGTVLIWNMVIVGGVTGQPRQPGMCKNRRVSAVTHRVRVCRQ